MRANDTQTQHAHTHSLHARWFLFSAKAARDANFDANAAYYQSKNAASLQNFYEQNALKIEEMKAKYQLDRKAEEDEKVPNRVSVCVRVYVCACVRVCVRVCVRACVRAYVHASTSLLYLYLNSPFNKPPLKRGHYLMGEKQ